jgi:hypothetical protein
MNPNDNPLPPPLENESLARFRRAAAEYESPVQANTEERFALRAFEKTPHIGDVMASLLKSPGQLWHALQSGTHEKLVLLALGLVSMFGMLLFGVTVGSFSGGVQWWAAPAKIIGGLLASGVLCMPSFYIFSSLAGVQASFRTLAGLLLATSALFAMLLAGLAPAIWVFSQSSDSVSFMGVILLLAWAVSAVVGTRFLLRSVSQLGLREKMPIVAWLIIFGVVVLQMSCVLRPLVGKADTLFPTEKKFFLEHWGEESGKR